jgi:sirohydrochlorin cobaltochelatase
MAPWTDGMLSKAGRFLPFRTGGDSALAFNELCAPTLEESVDNLIKKGATHMTVATTMFTPGGSHSQVEIPEILDHLRSRHPGVELRYAWPFDLRLVASTWAEQVRRFSDDATTRPS